MVRVTASTASVWLAGTALVHRRTHFYVHAGATRNLALGKDAYLSSTYGPTFPTSSFWAVDGRLDTIAHSNDTLLRNGGSDKNPVLSVDLGKAYSISRIVIVNRADW